MQSNKELVRVEKSSRYPRYLLIIGILALAFSLSFVLRSQPAEFGFELNEFDPFFNYRATQFIVENGLPAYLEWNDDLSWHPYGRDVSATSQVMLHTSAAMLYQTFGAGSTLYDFTILFPVVIGSLTTVIVFALVRVIGGTTAGLFASLFFAISPVIAFRGSIGWFKSEPLGLFFGLLGIYLVLSVINSDKGKISLAKIVGAGILLAFGVSAWGGIQFFILPIGFLFLALPFLRKDSKYIVWTSVVFTAAFFLVLALFERTGISFISNINGFFLVGCTAFLVVATIVKKISGMNFLRNISILLGGTVAAGIAIAFSEFIALPSFRYLNAANPFLIAQNMLTDSISEHTPTTMEHSFFLFSTLMIFAGIGAWCLFQKKVNHSVNIKGELATFTIIIGFLGMYFSSAFVRGEVFGAISIIILSSIGVSILVSKILNQNHETKNIVKTSFLGGIVILLLIPLFYPAELNWSNNNADIPFVIQNGGTQYLTATNDWAYSMQWLKENTPKDAVIAAWWDYGYWISALSERATISDNSTLLEYQIKKTALAYLSTPDNAWKILTSDSRVDVSENFVKFPVDGSDATNAQERKLEAFGEWSIGDLNKNRISNADEGNDWFDGSDDQSVPCGGSGPCPKYRTDPGKIEDYPSLFNYYESEVYFLPQLLSGLDADYVLINLAVEKLPDDNVMDLYVMHQTGGDETKVFWMSKIAGLDFRDYYTAGFRGYTDEFWNNTLMGKLIPFSPVIYVDPTNYDIQSETYKRGYIAIYVEDIKFPLGGDGPFELVYASPSYHRDDGGVMYGPLIYKINKEYIPLQYVN